MADLYGAMRNERTTLVLFNRNREQPTQAELAANAWTRLLLLREAARLHIDVPDADVIANIQSQPQFQKDGAYSPDLYREFSTFLLNTQHISADTYAALLHDQMRVAVVYRTLFSSVHALGSDVQARYDKGYGPVQVSYVSFVPAAYAATARVTPAEIEAAYKADPMNPAYRTDEKRQVEYVLFPSRRPRTSSRTRKRTPPSRRIGEKAVDFAQALEPDPNASSGAAAPAADFHAEAAKRGLAPVTTDFFTATSSPAGLPPSPAFNNAAFALTKDDPISKVVQLENGVVVMHLVQIQPSELKPLAEVSPAIEKQLQQQKAAQTAHAAATLAAADLKAAVAKGIDFKIAAAAHHLSVQTLPSFVPGKIPETDARLATFGYFSSQLAVGQVSDPEPVESDNSVVVMHVDSRAAGRPRRLRRLREKLPGDGGQPAAPSRGGRLGRLDGPPARHASAAQSPGLRRRGVGMGET